MFNCEINMPISEWHKRTGIPAKPKYAGFFEFNISTNSRYVKDVNLKRTREGDWILEYSHKKNITTKTDFSVTESFTLER